MELRYDLNTQKLEALIRDGVFSGKKIIAFGQCAATEEMIDYLEKRNFCVTAILDNNKAKWGGKYKSALIVAPDFIENITADHAVILIATRFFEQMSAQLRQLKYSGRIEKLIDYHSSAEYSLSGDTLKRKMERVLEGRDILKEIRLEFSKEHLVICPLNAIGDVYVSMMFLPEYLNRNKLPAAVAIVNGNGCHQVANMFGISAIAFGDAQMDALVQAVIFDGEPNSILAHHDRVYTDNTIKWLNKHKMTFEDYYRLAVFGLPRTAKPHYPTRLAPFENTWKLPKGKTVILAPYAKSVVGIPLLYWQELVEKYQARGYTVVTSTNGTEQPLSNTIGISFPLNQALSAVEFAGVFISIRSGLCDVIRNANCQKTVIFPDSYYSSTQWKLHEFWELPNWEQILYSR